MLKVSNDFENEWVFSHQYSTESDKGDFFDAIDLWESGNSRAAEKIFKDLISNNPYFIDAYHNLSLIWKATERPLEAYLASREAVSLGLSALPKEFSWSSSKLEWNRISNRPFLRAYHSLALHHIQRGEREVQLSQYSKICCQFVQMIILAYAITCLVFGLMPVTICRLYVCVSNTLMTILLNLTTDILWL